MKCCKYTSGMLRTVVEFQRAANVSDGAGGQIETWSAIAGAPTRGMFTPLSGREVFGMQRINAESRNRLVVRFFDGLLERDRVVIEGKAYNITYIRDVDFRHDWFEIDLTGGVGT